MVNTRVAAMGLIAGFALAMVGALAFAQQDSPGPLGLPSAEVLKEKLTLSTDQVKKVDSLYDDYKDKAKEVESKGDQARISAMRGEIVSKIKEFCTNNQQKMLDELVRDKK